MSNRPTLVLAVDDDPAILKLVELTVTRGGFQFRGTPTGAAFEEAFDRERPDACILDLNLPDTDGLKLLQKFRGRPQRPPMIMLTGSDAADTAVQAMKLGATDYLTKPFESERLLATLRNALLLADQERELQLLRAQVRDSWSLESIIGNSPRMREAKAQARKLLGSEANVLIRGESGTGKELFARALHFGGNRSKKPFIDVNCAALTESILESEIFGHEKGAFTGALSRHAGKFEQAEGGTIFLDEIGDMPLSTQAKLLRVLQERQFQRVGGTEKINVDVRVISATNQDLETLAPQGKFRQDLFYRINTVTLEIPPLRDRREDIPALVQHFLQAAARREAKPVPAVAPEAIRALEEHSWPGNVRELENVVTRAVVMSDARIESFQFSRGKAPAGGAPGAPAGAGLTEAVEHLERRMIQAALDRHGWVKARAARELGITERILSYKMEGFGMKRGE